MTKEQFEFYRKIENEIEDIRKFLFWCGKRYHGKCVSKFGFNFLTKGKELFIHRNSSLSTSEENTFNIPIKLQERIIEMLKIQEALDKSFMEYNNLEKLDINKIQMALFDECGQRLE